MPFSSGQTIKDRYRITQLLASGGFGTVYHAWDLNLKIPCAVKENLEKSTEAQRQFIREAELLAKLKHPNLPRVTDYFLIAGQGQYLVMDFIEGDDLEILRNRGGGALPESQVLPWIEQVCSALTYLHRQDPPIIHRDIKPANIKITPQGNAVLVDFGIARQQIQGRATTRGARAVTPGYSPPEQYTGVGTDTRSDIYAIGATLYTLLTGLVPTESVQRLASANRDIQAPSRVNSSIPKSVSDVIMRAMSLAPAQRFATVEDFQAALFSKSPKRPTIHEWLTTRRKEPPREPPKPPLPPQAPPLAGQYNPNDGPIIMRVSRSLEDARERVLHEQSGNLVQQIVNEIQDNSHPGHGKLIVVSGYQGVGTTRLAEMVYNRLDQTNHVILFIDTRGMIDSGEKLKVITDRLFQASLSNSEKSIKGLARRLHKEVIDVKKPQNFLWRIIIKIPIIVKLKKWLKIGGDAGVEIERTVSLDGMEKNKNPLEDPMNSGTPLIYGKDHLLVANLKRSLEEFLSVCIEKQIKLCFILDKVDKRETVQLLRDIFNRPNVIGIIVLETREEIWDPRDSDYRTYLPYSWNIAGLVLDQMVWPKNRHAIYPYFISYLNFVSQGSPKRFFEERISRFYHPKQPSLNKVLKWFGIRTALKIQIDPADVERIILLGQMYDRICKPLNEIFDLGNGYLLLNTDEEKRDQYIWALHDTVLKLEQLPSFGRITIANQLRSSGLNDCTGPQREKIADNIISKLVGGQLASQTRTGWRITGHPKPGEPGQELR